MIKNKSEEDLLFGSSSSQGQIIPNWMFFDILSSLSKASTEEGIWAKTKQIWQNCLEKLTFFQLQAKEHQSITFKSTKSTDILSTRFTSANICPQPACSGARSTNATHIFRSRTVLGSSHTDSRAGFALVCTDMKDLCKGFRKSQEICLVFNIRTCKYKLSCRTSCMTALPRYQLVWQTEKQCSYS